MEFLAPLIIFGIPFVCCLIVLVEILRDQHGYVREIREEED
jgi:hypothetical protein